MPFLSVDRLLREIHSGWFIRYIHMNGASFFFFFIYLHILKGIYYESFFPPRTFVWFLGCIMYILLMGIAFLGYVLPWGQMSYWGATVITNILTVFPIFGRDLLHWVWGAFAITNSTLGRFYSLHYLLPFFLLLFSLLHIKELHLSGSGNELGIRTNFCERINFSPYFFFKDLFGIMISFFFFFFIISFFPEIFNHSDNYENANPIVTPTHIVPEWYLLPYYAILRSIFDKTYGIFVMFLSIFVLFLLPLVDKDYVKSFLYKPVHRVMFFLFLFNFVFLAFLGSQDPDTPYIELSLFCAHIHLLYFLSFFSIRTYYNLFCF